MRRKGAATALLKKLFEIADDEELAVRAEYTPIDSEGETLKPFLMAMGFRETEPLFPVYCIDSLEKFTLDSRSLPGTKANIKTFEEAGDNILKQLKEEEEIDLCPFDGTIDESLSYIAMENDTFSGCVLTERIREDMFEITLVTAPEADLKGEKLMLSYVLDDIRSGNTPDVKIVIPVYDEETAGILDGIPGISAESTLGFLKDRFVEID